MNRYVLSIGSNTADCRTMMDRALQWLHSEFSAVETSRIYTTPPLSGVGSDYCNMVAALSSPLTPEELQALGKEFETSCGRSAESKLRQQVPMDVDVVICNGRVLRPAEISRSYFRIGFEQIRHNEIAAADENESV